MLYLQNVDYQSLLLGEEKWGFLLETAFRTSVMFTIILLALRLLGKRGVKQLSVFELGVIIGLGSAAGDPMFYKDVGLLPGIVVFAIVFSLYRLVTFLINRSDKFEQFVEGKPLCVIDDGKLLYSDFEREPIALDELFAQLRLHSVSHLGQVHLAIIETNGEVSVFYREDDEIEPGLPIIPAMLDAKSDRIAVRDYHSCVKCGNTLELEPGVAESCGICKSKQWVRSIRNKRIR